MGLTLVAPGQEREELRAEGYEAMQKGNIDTAISKYHSVFQMDSTDYDARLALGRLYYRAENMDSALYYFEMIYNHDSTDVEALHGMAKSYTGKGRTDIASDYASEAVRLMPEHLPSYLLWAKVLGYDGQIAKAIEVYRRALQRDSTLAEAWSGLGKMYYWESKPYSAEKYYRKAVSLDTQNADVQNQYNDVLDQLKLQAKGRYQYVQEKEETYQIEALIQRYGLQKRLTDGFQMSVHFLLDYSNRSYEQPEQNDTTRWYDNTWITASWIAKNHTISLNAGASNSDDRLTSYGLSWRYRSKLGKLALENTLNAGYTYYYYWNQVGRHALSENLKLTLSDLSLSLELGRGLTDEKPVRKYRSDPFTIKKNPYLSYGLSLGYKLIKEPDIKLNLTHSYYDFDYYSGDYYTPMERLLTGASVSVYHSFSSWYIYGMISGNSGSEKYYYLETNSSGEEEEVTGSIDADNWSGSFEAGYNKNGFSVSIGGSHFYNPYYENLIAFVALSFKF
ncbi:MAG: tetratricopeptide repeat protein [Bacteroidales bacterium]